MNEARHPKSDQEPQEERSIVAMSAEVYISFFFVLDSYSIIRINVPIFVLLAVYKSAHCRVVWLQALEELGLDAVDVVDFVII